MATLAAREGEEIWRTTTDGTVWVRVTDQRGTAREISVGGKAGAVLRIKSLDREVAQEAIFDIEADPFRNGLLKRADADQNEDEATATDQAFGTEELVKAFSKSGNAFQSFVNKLNEVNVRRMKDIAGSVDATQSQVAYLEQVTEEKYRKHGDTKTYREMMALDGGR